MVEIKDKNKIIYFVNSKDAENYTDYLKNGLKVIRKSNRTFYFNNGDKLINVSLLGEKKQRYVLVLRAGKTIKSEKLQRKHMQALSQ